MIFNKIFTVVNKILEMSNDNIYFSSYIPKNLTPVIISKRSDYDLTNSRTCMDCNCFEHSIY